MFTKKAILSMIEKEEITDLIDKEVQVQPAGLDLSLHSIYKLTTAGKIDFSNKERVKSDLEQIPFDEKGWVFLEPGVYLIKYNEVCHLPTTVAGIARTRSSILRCGASIHTGVWDPGYEGRSESPIIVSNEKGIHLKKNARVAQLILFPIDETESYSGVYQGENI
jgi:dUTP pyrophosphatase